MIILRVLLVEFDDCTRSIISALLRKSGYRVVSVPDGLKAWEILKASPKNIDLVLAEVELPSTSISGFSLLGMIMDDDICRNIPVIMMSPCDSVNTVYKCMLRGAADFLVKPVRKNELRNLWQHIWRRHSGGSLGQCDDKRDFSQKQIEAIDESSSTKNSNHCVKSPKENRDSSDKGSDSQSSCTKPNMEDDTDVKDDGAMLINDNDAEDKSVKLTCEAVSCIPNNYSTSLMQEEGHADARRMSPVNDSTQEIQVGDAYVEIKPFYRNDEQQPKSSKEAMDLIGSFDTHLNVHSTHSNTVIKFDQ